MENKENNRLYTDTEVLDKLINQFKSEIKAAHENIRTQQVRISCLEKVISDIEYNRGAEKEP